MTRSIKRILTSVLMLLMVFSMVIGVFAAMPFTAQAANSEPAAVSAEAGATASTDKKLSEYPNGLQLMNDTGWYFDTDYKITWAGQSGQYWLNGKQISYTDGEMTMNILRYTDSENNSYRASFFVYNGSFGLWWVTPDYSGIPNYYEFEFQTWISDDVVQYESPQSADDLYVTADGYIYYKFTHIIGDKAGTTDVYYLSSNGFSETVPESDAAVQFEIAKLEGTVELTELDEYPYGTEMYSYEVILNVDTVGTTYQWQMADSKDGTYTNISGATQKTYYIEDEEYTDKWFRCVIDGTKVTKSVELFYSYSTSYSLVGVSGNKESWYISNGVMGYANNMPTMQEL